MRARRRNALRARLFSYFPHHMISRITLWLTRRETRFKNPFVRLFIRTFGVDMSEALQPDPAAHPSFNAFFTRALKSKARPISDGLHDIACPADGAINQLGDIADGRMLQAKDQCFAVQELLGGSSEHATPFANGKFCTVYLSPRDYHRVHMPVAGRLLEMIHVPGRLFTVATFATEHIPRLFARNERVAAVFDTDAGPLAMVMVGAVNVAAIEMTWAGVVTPPKGKTISVWDYTQHKPGIQLERGQEMGCFNMGSTIIALFANPGIVWANDLGAGSLVKMGQRLGECPLNGLPVPP